MPRTPIEKSMRELHSLTPLLRERLQSGRNLVYYASGEKVRDAYFSLPFDNVVLVDYCFQEIFNIEKNVITIGLTALQATAAFKEAGIRFDAFVCINEGLSEGGGYYPINGNWSMGTILPILKDTYLHIACPGYYGRTRWREKMFNLPHQVSLLNATDPDYLDPFIFTEYNRYGKEAGVWRVTKQPSLPVSFKVGKRTITLQRKNIWDDYDRLDTLMVRCSPSEERQLQQIAPKAKPLYRPKYYRSDEQEVSFEEILHYCNLHQVDKLGLTPWLGGNYNRFVNYLKANEARFPYPQEVHFYHLHHNDYQELYQQAGENTRKERTIVELP